MNIKRNIIFTVEKRKKAGVLIEKNVPIRMRVLFCGNRIEFTTGYRIDLKNWLDQKQAVKNGTTNALKQSAADINAEIQYFESEIQKIFKAYEVKEVVPTTEQVKNSFLSAIKKETESNSSKSFFDIYDQFMEEEGTKNNWTANTYEKMQNVRKHLFSFEPKLQFSTFNEQGLTAYIEYFRNKKFRNSTIDKQFNFLKWFLNWSYRKGYHKNIDFQVYKPRLKRVPKPIIFLNVAELTKIKGYKIDKNYKYLEKIRDVFLFCCYTSLRYSDVYQLKKSNIKDGIIDIISVKTGKQLLIELNNYSRSILDKYKDVSLKGDKALPVISNQRFNDYLKELGRLAELKDPVNITYYLGKDRIDETFEKWELLSTHAGRRTFICNGLALGIPPQVVMKWTGHCDYKSMKPYIDIADDIKASAMDKFNQI